MNPEAEVLQILYHQFKQTKSKLTFNEWLMKPKSITVVIIDPFTREVYQTTMDGTLESIYEEIGNGCEVFEVVRVDGLTDLLVDEEIIFHKKFPLNGFIFQHHINPIFGRAIVTGKDKNGEMKSCPFTPEGVLKMIKAWTVTDVQEGTGYWTRIATQEI